MALRAPHKAPTIDTHQQTQRNPTHTTQDHHQSKARKSPLHHGCSPTNANTTITHTTNHNRAILYPTTTTGTVAATKRFRPSTSRSLERADAHQKRQHTNDTGRATERRNRVRNPCSTTCASTKKHRGRVRTPCSTTCSSAEEHRGRVRTPCGATCSSAEPHNKQHTTQNHHYIKAPTSRIQHSRHPNNANTTDARIPNHNRTTLHAATTTGPTPTAERL